MDCLRVAISNGCSMEKATGVSCRGTNVDLHAYEYELFENAMRHEKAFLSVRLVASDRLHSTPGGSRRLSNTKMFLSGLNSETCHQTHRILKGYSPKSTSLSPQFSLTVGIMTAPQRTEIPLIELSFHGQLRMFSPTEMRRRIRSKGSSSPGYPVIIQACKCFKTG